MELAKVFANAAYQHAFEEWYAFMKLKNIWMEPDVLKNIAEAQRRPMSGEPGSGLGYSYIGYFTRASWDKTMPPIEQIQIIDPVPSIDMIPDIDIVPDIRMVPSIDWIPR